MRHYAKTTWLVVVFGFLQHVVVAEHQETRSGELKHRGVYTGHVPEYELVTPRKVTSEGAFLSHDVTYHHGESHRKRKKRSIYENQTNDAILHYQLSMPGRSYHIELWPSQNFIAPALVVERRGEGNLTSRHYQDGVWRDAEPSKMATTCHYHGLIRGQPTSSVALSACNGLVGVVRSSEGEFWLEPVEGGLTITEHTHMVFKRAATTTADPRKKRRKKRRRHEKNCGTREPRRVTELEWKETKGEKVKVQGRSKRRKGRWRRSTSVERHVEALLVADPSMMAFHQDRDVETYFLTIMNMVSLLYLDPSIGNPINVVVVRIVLLFEDDVGEKKLNVTVNADQTLESFCTWQLKMNTPDDNHPNHHDVAILVTREDICAHQNSPCSTLGVAHVAGMCHQERSCNVNEDNGITLAHTITHEMGHNFGMYHDTEKVGCNRRMGPTLHVMTPSFEADTVGVAWSSCSRRDITHFLDQGLGNCLEDEPSSDYKYPDLPPGAMYNAEHQCRLQFGTQDTSVCSPPVEICSRLWCVVNGMCTTMLRPAAPGTYCGKHMWCLDQKCVTIGEKPEPIHGGWSNWGPWTECSRSCGAGVSVAERYCDHPVPTFGGRFCVGERRRYKVCNTEKCSEESPSFRAVQCSRYNDKDFHGRKYKWMPYFDQAEPCELYCADSDDSMIVPFGDSVDDGTPCNVGTNDMCIKGICKRVSCDWVVDSNSTEDQCGICQGDGSQCETKSGVFTRKQGSGYKEVVVIPSGSRNIMVEELGHSKNYIGIGSPFSRKFYLNGKRQITLADEYQVAGSTALYEREKDMEKVRIPGPINEDILIYLIYNGRYRNFGLRYEFTIPRQEPAGPPEYRWTFSDWSPCSATCGGGTQSSAPVCLQKGGGGLVNVSLCEMGRKPDMLMRVCNTHPCPARWWTGPWQICPATCGDGITRKRSVMCAVLYSEGSSGREIALPDNECKGQDKPPEKEPCPNLPPCTAPTTSRSTQEPPLYTTSSPKTETLFYLTTASFLDQQYFDNQEDKTFDNQGDKTDLEDSQLSNLNYTVESDAEKKFQSNDVLLHESIRTKEEDKNVLQFVDSVKNSTAMWVIGEWGECSVECGVGQRTRTVDCFSTKAICDIESKPSETEKCSSNVGCDSWWQTGAWSPCSITCGPVTGYQQRRVMCVSGPNRNLRPAEDCRNITRPVHSQSCRAQQVCLQHSKDAGAKSCTDKLALCSSVTHLCAQSWYIRTQCCQSCTKR